MQLELVNFPLIGLIGPTLIGLIGPTLIGLIGPTSKCAAPGFI